MRRLDIRVSDETVITLDEKGDPLLTVQKDVRTMGKGGVIHLPNSWQNAKVIVIKLPDDF